MDSKTQKASTGENTGAQFSSTVKDSAQQIWLAGLGAFSKAQEEGGKVFDALVKEGLSIQRKTHASAEEKIAEAAGRLTGLASDIQAKAGDRWDKLENIFEERVAKALNKLGVPSARDVAALIARIDELNRNVQQLSAAAKPAPRTAAKSAAKAAAKAPVKRKPARKTT